jgi:hypothetical protein
MCALTSELAPLFCAVETTLKDNRLALDQADLENGNHGAHMIAIFHLAAQAAQEKQNADLPEVFFFVSQLLEQQKDNGSAQLYAQGMAQFAVQFRKADITLDELLAFVRKAMIDEPGIQAGRSGDLLKALLSGLVAWQNIASGKPESASPLDMSALFELGIAYVQAKQRGGTRAEIFADAAVNASPLKHVPHRCQSGKLAIQALLEAMAASPAPGSGSNQPSA